METKKYAVIIKHPYRDWDWRVDIVEVGQTLTTADVKRIVEYEMLGPFEVLAVTEKLSLHRELTHFPKLPTP